jgi:hypothetical protein
MTEKEMREADVPNPGSADTLAKYIDGLVKQQHDYGTCVYAMSMSAVAALNYVAHALGVTGFQASCADMDILRRTRRMERFGIQDYSNLLYPQYAEKFKSFSELIVENAKWLREEACALLAKKEEAHPDVRAHWKMLSELPVAPEGKKE